MYMTNDCVILMTASKNKEDTDYRGLIWLRKINGIELAA